MAYDLLLTCYVTTKVSHCQRTVLYLYFLWHTGIGVKEKYYHISMSQNVNGANVSGYPHDFVMCSYFCTIVICFFHQCLNCTVLTLLTVTLIAWNCTQLFFHYLSILKDGSLTRSLKLYVVNHMTKHGKIFNKLLCGFLVGVHVGQMVGIHRAGLWSILPGCHGESTARMTGQQNEVTHTDGPQKLAILASVIC